MRSFYIANYVQKKLCFSMKNKKISLFRCQISWYPVNLVSITWCTVLFVYSKEFGDGILRIPLKSPQGDCLAFLLNLMDLPNILMKYRNGFVLGKWRMINFSVRRFFADFSEYLLTHITKKKCKVLFGKYYTNTKNFLNS